VLETHDLLSRTQERLLIPVSVQLGKLVAEYLTKRESMVGASRFLKGADGDRSETG
jgi:hypothetical protein